MYRSRWLVSLFGIFVLATICVNVFTEQCTTALATDAPTDLLKRIETLEARVAMLFKAAQQMDQVDQWESRIFGFALLAEDHWPRRRQ